VPVAREGPLPGKTPQFETYASPSLLIATDVGVIRPSLRTVVRVPFGATRISAPGPERPASVANWST
jgi:hypothetical protein